MSRQKIFKKLSVVFYEKDIQLFEDFSKLIPETSIQKEKERWYELRGYDYNQISSFLDTRIPLIDKKMNTYLEEKWKQ